IDGNGLAVNGFGARICPEGTQIWNGFGQRIWNGGLPLKAGHVEGRGTLEVPRTLSSYNQRGPAL
ncbi:MAG: hypothetical protein ACPGWR_32640, partial [Ardenticatenaceae bacterium]